MRYPIRLLICFIALAGASGTPGAAASLQADWAEALAPMANMPVQSSGFIRSATAFAETQLREISGRKTLDGLPALEAVLRLAANPAKARSASLLRISHPELAKIFKAKRISLNEWRAPDRQQQVALVARTNLAAMQRPLNDLEDQADRLDTLEKRFAIVPGEGEWRPAAMGVEGSPPADAAIVANWKALKEAILADNPKEAEKAARALSEHVSAAAIALGADLTSLHLDTFYTRHRPFEKSAWVYLFAALCFGSALILGRRWPAWPGVILLVLGFGEQVLGVSLRWILSGRAPLSNMYESFTFAIAGMILAAVAFEAIYRNRLAGLGGGTLGFFFMTLAHRMPIFDSGIQPLMPALQSSWLTYHVATIMLSYSAFALSLFISLCYLVKDALGGDGSPALLLQRLPRLESLDALNYKIIAVGFPLLTLGIVFGAVWAATAWGRPWGFDPKETWSAITWLVYAIYLHVRFMAGWKGRRAAILSVAGFACVLFTYFGVNYLLSGLHSYA